MQRTDRKAIPHAVTRSFPVRFQAAASVFSLEPINLQHTRNLQASHSINGHAIKLTDKAMFVISTCSPIINRRGLGPVSSSLATCTTCTRGPLETRLFYHQPSGSRGLSAASGPHSTETLVGQCAECVTLNSGGGFPRSPTEEDSLAMFLLPLTAGFSSSSYFTKNAHWSHDIGMVALTNFGV